MKNFTPAELRTIDETKYFYMRAGSEHRFIPIWVVVVDGRVLVRPWNNRKTGWYRVFLDERLGTIRIGAKEVPVRCHAVRGKKLNDLMDRAYAAKYTSKANEQYVKGFATSKRRATTLALVPWQV